MESLLGVIDAAEYTRSPVIIGFNGEFLSSPGRLTHEKLEWYGALGKAAAEASSVPCGFIFNECPDESQVRKAVLSGFNLVMLSGGERSSGQYLENVASLTSFAHRNNVAVEAELGELPSGLDDPVEPHRSSTTDPELAAFFVSKTQVDILSVSVGNIHILMNGQRDLDLECLEEIHKRVDIPLGLHGGTGISNESIRQAIHLGVAKINYGTYLKLRYLDAQRKAFNTVEENPHKLLGMGGKEDVLVTGRLAIRDAVLERIELLGCCGRA